MSRKKNGGGAGHHSGTPANQIASAAASSKYDSTDPNGIRAVHGAAYGPTFGRALWVYPVDCPRGHGVHMHRGGPPKPEGHLRSAPCGETYVILARTVLPAATPIGIQRRGAA